MKTKSRLRIISLSLLFIILFALLPPAVAQTYSFAVPDLKMQVYIQPDASVKIVYDITFENYGSEIDIVDIGLPHKDYDISNMRASIDGVALSRIYESEYIDIGVEVHLGDQGIPYNQRGTLHFECTLPNMVYQDTTRKDHASLQITPTWFDASSVLNTSNIQVAIHMIEGISPDELLHQGTNFTSKALFQGRAIAVWQWPNDYATGAHNVGISFPQRGMTTVIKMSLLDITNKWLEENPGARVSLGLIAVILLAVLFFRFSGGTGFTVFVILAALSIFIFVVSPLAAICVPPLLLPFLALNEISLKKKKKTYLPPIAQVEGGGIKRGLTAPEAAILLEVPFNKVLTLIIFGLLEKGLVEQTKASPLTVTVVDAYRAMDRDALTNNRERRKFRRRVAQNNGTVIHNYENTFMNFIEVNSGKAVGDIKFSKAMEGLLKGTAAKMKGFDLSDTQDYYRRVIARAMGQAAALGEIKQREQYLDKYLPWVMMDDNYPTVTSHRGYHYWPRWTRSSSRGPRIGGGSKASGRVASGGKTSFSDVAASFAGWTEATMGGLAGAIMPSSMNIPGAKGGFMDLSGVDRATGDIFEALATSAASSGGSSSGGGSSCACACAGCACACACAGGGR